MPWWSSHSAAVDDEVVPSRGVAESETFANIQAGKDRNYGTDSGIAVTEFDRMRDQQKIRRIGDGRAAALDVESIDCLVQRYEKEFKEADSHIKKRVADEHFLKFYDYNNDRRYQQWTKEQEALREKLQIHWIDWCMDRPSTCLVFMARIFTTAGLLHGLGRTAYLYRTMDKAYAKLNGVSLGSIAFSEIRNSVAKGAGIAVAATAGVVSGEATAKVSHVIWSGDVSVPQRCWQYVFVSGLFSGAFAGAAYVGMSYLILNMWGVKTIMVGSTAVGSAVGLYLGYVVYRPFAAQRQHQLYNPYWRPWQTRQFRPGGPTMVRGKYV